MPRTRFRWLVVGLIFFITVVNYVDRSALSYAVHGISAEFGFDTTAVGRILGAFGIGYIVTTFLGGIWADHYGARLTLFGASLLWSVSIGMTGLASGFVMLYAARVLLGVAEGPNFPALNRAVADWLSSRERAIALSNSLVAVPLALAIGAPLVTQLILHLGWRGMFLVLMVLGALWLPLWWFLFRDFPEQSPHVDAAELAHIRDGAERRRDPAALHARRSHGLQLWRFLLSNPTLLANDWAFFVFGYYLFFFMTWLPSYFQQVYHLDLKQVGLFNVLPWLSAAVLLWAFGYLSDWLLKRTDSLRIARSHPIWISQLLAALCILPVIYTHSFGVALGFITLAVALSMSTNSAYYAINVDVARERSGTALGVMDALFALAGYLAPTLTGELVAGTGSFETVFWVLAGLALSSVLVVLLFHHPDRSETLRSSQFN
ncbi:MAG TPA: MFS transporter [Gammaproteobacteria bacterium]|nr:MFS transporter [Gammaproteobacteria bacterium]